mmetsp:Transcript_26974/g.27216  ORF Transcript_26974/g.27216 Transcript_26974/m.27216 type:complete len:336 (+) Transcript_26974:46-1053(+)
MSNIIYIFTAVYLFSLALAAEVDLEQTPKRGQLRRKNRGRKRQQFLESENGRTQRLKAVTVNYPIEMFDSKINWRAPAKLNSVFKNQCDNDASYTEQSRAQDQEDLWIYENWFYGMENGVIMESGALDGILFSNSYFYEKVANWTAIHVEADPENYANLMLNRPHAVNVNGALCSESRPLHYSSEGVIPVRGFIEFMTASFIKKWHGKVHNGVVKIEDLPTVQCVPVRHLLHQLHVTHVDLWILDVEGAEESVLRGTDFKAVSFNIVAMECDEHDILKNARKTDILEANGFQCKLIERNCMCKHRSYQPSARREKSLLKKYDGHSWTKTYVNKGF